MGALPGSPEKDFATCAARENQTSLPLNTSFVRTRPPPCGCDGLPSSVLETEYGRTQGRFSDAHAEAENARDLDPFGKAVRLLCPRLMALHSEDARSQVSKR